MEATVEEAGVPADDALSDIEAEDRGQCLRAWW